MIRRHARRILSARGGAGAALLALLLAGCAGSGVTTGQGADPSAARGLLVAAATQGPVPLAVDQAPPVFAGGEPEVATIATNALQWLSVRLTPVPYDTAVEQRRLVLKFTDVPRDPAAVCAGNTQPGVGSSPVKLQAVFCDGRRSVADAYGTAAGTATEDADRLIRATLDRLFPGRTGSDASGGYGLPGVSVGVGVGSGRNWGLGGGLFF